MRRWSRSRCATGDVILWFVLVGLEVVTYPDGPASQILIRVLSCDPSLGISIMCAEETQYSVVLVFSDETIFMMSQRELKL